MTKRLPYKNNFFEQLTFLDPQIALFHEGRFKIRDLSGIVEHLKIIEIDITKLAVEWITLPSVFTDLEKKELASLEIDEMCRRILECKDCNDQKIFSNLQLLVDIVLTFPHSNAEAERIFSIVTDVKNKKRNKLSNETISAISIVRSSFQTENINCVNFEPDCKHFELYNKGNLYAQQSTSSDGT